MRPSVTTPRVENTRPVAKGASATGDPELTSAHGKSRSKVQMGFSAATRSEVQWTVIEPLAPWLLRLVAAKSYGGGIGGTR